MAPERSNYLSKCSSFFPNVFFLIFQLTQSFRTKDMMCVQTFGLLVRYNKRLLHFFLSTSIQKENVLMEETRDKPTTWQSCFWRNKFCEKRELAIISFQTYTVSSNSFILSNFNLIFNRFQE